MNLLVQNNKTIITNTHIGNTCDMYTSHLRHIHDPVILSQDRRYMFTFFLLILDRIMKRMKGLRKRGMQWSMKERLEDLDYADDICLLAH